MADSLSETKITIQLEEEKVVSLLYPYEQITVDNEKTSTKARTPCQSTPDAVGYDIYWAKTGDIQLGERKKFAIDTVTRPARGFHLKIFNRSSLACNEGIIIPGTPMIVDRDYRGVIKVTFWNTTVEPFHVEKGDRIGQLIIDRSYKIFWKPVKGLHQEKTGQDPAGLEQLGTREGNFCSKTN